jgi:periplasmic divalent cation tolerance protein
MNNYENCCYVCIIPASCREMQLLSQLERVGPSRGAGSKDQRIKGLEGEEFVNEILVLSTTDTPELAQKIASALVQSHEAACVNIVPGIRSVYFWEGKECNEQECLLLIKSTNEKFEAIRARIRQLHSYQIPEIIAVPVSAGDPAYLAWLHSSLQG